MNGTSAFQGASRGDRGDHKPNNTETYSQEQPFHTCAPFMRLLVERVLVIRTIPGGASVPLLDLLPYFALISSDSSLTSAALAVRPASSVVFDAPTMSVRVRVS